MNLSSKFVSGGVGGFMLDGLRANVRSFHRDAQAAAGGGPYALRPFTWRNAYVPPARLENSPRLESLVRGGNLYLSVQDVIALVLENNLDIAVQRYSPFLAREVLRRTQGGGYLRQVDSPLLARADQRQHGGRQHQRQWLAGGAGIGSGGGIVSQIGPMPPNLDPDSSTPVIRLAI